MTEGVIEKFGKYELIEKIASGGMAEVFRARSRGAAGFEKILVIKKILPNLAKEKEFRELFIDEARIAVQLVNVNIVQVFALDEIDGQYFIAMEYVKGLDLSRLIVKARPMGPFPIHLTLFIISEVLKALQFAHHRKDDKGNLLNIVHCDISPQNILVSFFGEVKLTDFGISRAAFQMEEQHQVIRGKYAYMAPEQVEGKPLTGQTDIFALTIVFFEMLTGRRLFKGKDRGETLMRVRNADVPPVRQFRHDVSEKIEKIVQKGLAKNLSDRYQHAGEMLEDISWVMAEENYRATSNDLAIYIRDAMEADNPSTLAGLSSANIPMPVAPKDALPQTIVVCAVEIVMPPRSLATPRLSTSEMMNVWTNIITKAKGDIWERNDGSMIAVWRAQDSLEATCKRVIQCAKMLRKQAKNAEYRSSVGISPGGVRLQPDTNKPTDEWDLAGPFFLARWMMNLSAHRGRMLTTEVVASCVEEELLPIGRIPIQANKCITLFEFSV